MIITIKMEKFDMIENHNWNFIGMYDNVSSKKILSSIV